LTPNTVQLRRFPPKKLRVQSAYDSVGKNNKGGRKNYVEKEREKRRGERGKFVD